MKLERRIPTLPGSFFFFFFFFFFFLFFLLGRTGIEARTRGGERRQEKRQDTRFPSRWVMLGASRFVQEPVDVPTRRQTRIDPRHRQTFLEIIFISPRGGEGKREIENEDSENLPSVVQEADLVTVFDFSEDFFFFFFSKAIEESLRFNFRIELEFRDFHLFNCEDRNFLRILFWRERRKGFSRTGWIKGPD